MLLGPRVARLETDLGVEEMEAGAEAVEEAAGCLEAPEAWGGVLEAPVARAALQGLAAASEREHRQVSARGVELRGGSAFDSKGAFTGPGGAGGDGGAGGGDGCGGGGEINTSISLKAASARNDAPTVPPPPIRSTKMAPSVPKRIVVGRSSTTSPTVAPYEGPPTMRVAKSGLKLGDESRAPRGISYGCLSVRQEPQGVSSSKNLQWTPRRQPRALCLLIP